jgi:hypothetical protein
MMQLFYLLALSYLVSCKSLRYLLLKFRWYARQPITKHELRAAVHDHTCI